jgi:hypothetical protein
MARVPLVQMRLIDHIQPRRVERRVERAGDPFLSIHILVLERP